MKLVNTSQLAIAQETLLTINERKTKKQVDKNLTTVSTPTQRATNG